MVRICYVGYTMGASKSKSSPTKPTPLDRAKNKSATSLVFFCPKVCIKFSVCFFCGIIRRRPPAPICNAVFRLAQLVVSCPDVLVDIKRQNRIICSHHLAAVASRNKVKKNKSKGKSKQTDDKLQNHNKQ
ncbi:hypothetical protein F4805DRAFT_174348 [Annulohypoxylon moriforme]|nr:hypothetical protein F4805DRAFT_174348 [Annulohypoxylon moriforme]